MFRAKDSLVVLAVLPLLLALPQAASAAVTLTSPTSTSQKPSGTTVALTGRTDAAGEVLVMQSPWPYTEGEEQQISSEPVAAGGNFKVNVKLKYNARYWAVLMPEDGGQDQRSQTVGVWRKNVAKAKCRWQNYTDGAPAPKWKANDICSITAPKEVVAGWDQAKVWFWVRRSTSIGWRRLGSTTAEADGSSLKFYFGFWNTGFKTHVWAHWCFDVLDAAGKLAAPFGPPSSWVRCSTKRFLKSWPKKSSYS